MKDLSVSLGDLTLSTPLVAAAGTVGSVVEFKDVIDFRKYGAAVAKSVSPEPWKGRPSPRIGHAGVGMLNGIGIQNPGIDAWLDEIAPDLPDIPVPVWGSAVAHDVEGFAIVASKMQEADLEAIEINLSCPNLEGIPFALDPARSAQVVSHVRAATTLPIGAKLSPDAQPVSEVAMAVVDAGADWVVMGNTVMGAAIDPHTRRPVLSGVVGGYSGDPIRPIAVRCVLEIRAALPDTPIVACGGVSHADHVLEYLLAGADAVAIGSAHFNAPRIADRISKDLRTYMTARGIERLHEMKGAWESWI